MRIIVSTPTFLPTIGGAELGVHEIYRRLAEKHEVIIITPRRPYPSSQAGRGQDYQGATYRVTHPLANLEAHCPSLIIKILHRTALSYLVTLINMHRRKAVDVINFHYIEPHGLALIALRWLFRTPTVLSLVGRSDVMKSLGWWRRTYANAVLASADAILPNSTYYLKGESRRRVEVVPYGVDTGEFSPARRSSELRAQLGADDGRRLLLSVQRLAPVKRVDILIRAMSKISERDSGVRLVVVGSGEEEASLRRLTHDLELTDVVTFVGYVSSDVLPVYFASADIFVFHSMVETFGIVFAQAMASGLPIVAAESSCVPDVVGANNGILVSPFDIDAFADAVVRLVGDEKQREAIGKRNRVRAQREFDWQLIADRYEEILVAAASDRV